MTSISEIKLKVTPSLLGDKSVLYLSNGSCPSVDKHIKRNHKKVSEYISENSYKFVYLPELLSSLSGEIRTYLFPGLTASDEDSVITHIQSLLFKGESRNGFIRQEDGQIFFYDLVNPMQNAINVKVSRVKAAFKSAVSDRVAKFYYIDGVGGEAKKIHLDRDNVIWDR